MKVLVTGYKGFIGQHAINKLETLNIPYEVYEWGEMYPKFQQITHVMHFGAISSTTETDWNKVMMQNYDFSKKLLCDCEYRNIHFQWSSSASIYGSGNNFKEDAPPDPRSPYSTSKWLFERFTTKNSALDIPVQAFRYFNVYGDRGEEHKGDQASPYHKFREQAKQTGIIKLFEGSENYLRDFIHVDDVLNIQFSFLNIRDNGIWNIGTGKPKSFLEVGREIAIKTGATIEFIPMPENLKNSYQKYTCADLTKLHKTLGIS